MPAVARHYLLLLDLPCNSCLTQSSLLKVVGIMEGLTDHVLQCLQSHWTT